MLRRSGGAGRSSCTGDSGEGNSITSGSAETGDDAGTGATRAGIGAARDGTCASRGGICTAGDGARNARGGTGVTRTWCCTGSGAWDCTPPLNCPRTYCWFGAEALQRQRDFLPLKQQHHAVRRSTDKPGLDLSALDVGPSPLGAKFQWFGRHRFRHLDGLGECVGLTLRLQLLADVSPRSLGESPK